MSSDNKLPHDDSIYRVFINKRKELVEVICLGMNSVDSEAEGFYSSVDDLPNWIQKRMAVLLLCDPTPPTEEVRGVGFRVDADTFWVYHDEC
jgi:hypothetical protein